MNSILMLHSYKAWKVHSQRNIDRKCTENNDHYGLVLINDNSQSKTVCSSRFIHPMSYSVTWIQALNVCCECRQRPYIRETMHSALNLYCTIRAQLSLLLGGVPVNPRC